jgi:glycosyltransferase involved in cell wall biosynthesis
LNWTWRTWKHLSESGFACHLVDQLPAEGIVVCAACNLSLFHRPRPRQVIVCCIADSPPPFFTQLNVYQCRTQADQARLSRRLPASSYVPHWPQPGILARDRARGNAFENVDYFGAADQLAPELRHPDFIRDVKALGLTLRFHFEFYHDYTTTDAVLAARSFGGATVRHKPGSKLVNAWLAGVPAVLGVEEGFRELRHAPEDYLEIDSPDACLAALRTLRDDADLRQRMRLAASQRAASYSSDVFIARWRELLEKDALAVQVQWQRMSAFARQAYFLREAARRFSHSLRRRLGEPRR